MDDDQVALEGRRPHNLDHHPLDGEEVLHGVEVLHGKEGVMEAALRHYHSHILPW